MDQHWQAADADPQLPPVELAGQQDALLAGYAALETLVSLASALLHLVHLYVTSRLGAAGSRPLGAGRTAGPSISRPAFKLLDKERG